ncbi:MAG: LLM class F420-dependent oxidoreductase [Microthrixaceae bacterium]
MLYAVIPPYRSGVVEDPDWMAGFARHAEKVGIESIVVVEHGVIISGYQSRYPYSSSGRMPLVDRCSVPDPLELLSFLAGVTETLVLATGALVIPEHHPVLLAKRLATLDRLSKGRVRICGGVGWMREELEACGVDFTTRGRRMDECIDVMRLLWGPEPDGGLTHEGEFFRFDAVHSNPKPFRATGVPIHIAGHSNAAARRAGARGDGLQPLGLDGPELDACLATMRQAALDAGRDPSTLELSLGAPMAGFGQDDLERLTRLGADRIVLSAPQTTDLAQICDEMSEFAATVGLS